MALVHSIVGEWATRSVTYQVVEVTAIALITFVVYNFIHSLYCRKWHPLSKFPGEPKAATSGGWIYRVTARGFPEEELEKLHKKYRMYTSTASSHLNRPLGLMYSAET